MTEELAVEGGPPVRSRPLAFRRPHYGDDERRQILEVFEQGIFCSSFPEARKVRQLESSFASCVGSKFAIAFNSGTTAQHASLVAAGVGPGDEVIVPPLTFASTAYTVLMVGATPVFADVDDNTFNLDPGQAAQAVTSRTRAIVAVHWFGHPAAMDELLSLGEQHGLTVIEDCAHAIGTVYRGRKAGTLGAMACWSLHAGKMITAAGEGGLLTTDSPELAAVARSVCNHGKDQGPDRSGPLLYEIVRVGNNYRLSEIQAAFALAQLDRLDEIRRARRVHAKYLDSDLQGLPGLKRPRPWQDVELAYSYYPLRFDEEFFEASLEEISRALKAEGIGNATLGEELCYVHPIFRESCGSVSLPVAERIARELMLLPLYPDLTQADLDDVVRAVGKIVQAYRRETTRAGQTP